MERNGILAIGVVCLVLLAGCSGAGPSGNQNATTSIESTTAGTTAATTTADTTTGSDATTTDATETTTQTTTATTTTTPTWTEPSVPNKPLQNKMEESGNRIDSVTVAGDGFTEGTSTVSLTVAANTSMPRVDPAEHGTVRGEPYLLAYVNTSFTNGTRFSTVNGTLIERSAQLHQESNGEYTLTLHREALESTDVDSGTVEVLVLLMDRDSMWDDIYGFDRVTVEYVPDE